MSIEDDAVMIAQADLIAQGLIYERSSGVWRLTDKGKDAAMEAFNSLGATKTALVMIATAQSIEGSI